VQLRGGNNSVLRASNHGVLRASDYGLLRPGDYGLLRPGDYGLLRGAPSDLLCTGNVYHGIFPVVVVLRRMVYELTGLPSRPFCR
jgi:hypothetical protein